MRRSTSRRSARPIGIVILVLLAALFFSRLDTVAPPNPGPGDFTGKCVGVTDGDTIRVMHLGRSERVRLYGVDCPEKNQDYGTAAKKFTSQMVFGATVTVEYRGEDRYGRTLGWVVAPDGRVLNVELVKAGMAWWYREYDPRDTVLERAEQQARAAKRGLWSRENPIPPWEFRARER